MARDKKKAAVVDATVETSIAVSVTEPTASEPVFQSIMGFDADLSCRGFKFETGKTYEVSGAIIACNNGFHACPDDEHPLSVFGYYPPTSRFALVTQSGETNKEGDKLASAKITINAESRSAI
jgi:hypothetical protein